MTDDGVNYFENTRIRRLLDCEHRRKLALFLLWNCYLYIYKYNQITTFLMDGMIDFQVLCLYILNNHHPNIRC